MVLNNIKTLVSHIVVVVVAMILIIFTEPDQMSSFPEKLICSLFLIIFTFLYICIGYFLLNYKVKSVILSVISVATLTETLLVLSLVNSGVDYFTFMYGYANAVYTFPLMMFDDVAFTFIEDLLDYKIVGYIVSSLLAFLPSVFMCVGMVIRRSKDQQNNKRVG